jgi:hypothetical protein
LGQTLLVLVPVLVLLVLLVLVLVLVLVLLALLAPLQRGGRVRCLQHSRSFSR